jgi:hypothetical protein
MNKSQARNDMKYVREVMRQMEDALKKNDFQEVGVMANEAACCLIGILDRSEKGA